MRRSRLLGPVWRLSDWERVAPFSIGEYRFILLFRASLTLRAPRLSELNRECGAGTPRMISAKMRNGSYVPPLDRDPGVDATSIAGGWGMERLRVLKGRNNRVIKTLDALDGDDRENGKYPRHPRATDDSSLVSDLRAPIITPPSVYHEVTRMTRYRGQRAFSNAREGPAWIRRTEHNGLI